MPKAKTYNNREALMKALAAVIDAAPEKERNVLSQALEDYAYAYPRSYRQMDRGGQLVASFLNTIEEAADCRIIRDNCDLPDRGALDD
jgi:uncharacterized protein YdiU (UPF0061 family)